MTSLHRTAVLKVVATRGANKSLRFGYHLIHLVDVNLAVTGKVYSPLVRMDPETNDRWHAELRRRDAEDIATGRRTPEQVNQDNAWIPNPQDWVIRNLFSATRALKKRR
jgi:hypothetical protein